MYPWTQPWIYARKRLFWVNISLLGRPNLYRSISDQNDLVQLDGARM